MKTSDSACAVLNTYQIQSFQKLSRRGLSAPTVFPSVGEAQIVRAKQELEQCLRHQWTGVRQEGAA